MENTKAKLFKTIEAPNLSVEMKTIAAAVAVVSAVVFPQLFHMLGNTLGVQTALGELLLPMHLPVILVGMLAGPYAGAVTGLAAPIISFTLTGMPRAEVLVFMTFELFAYGLFAGLMRNIRLNVVLKVFAVQLIGRFVRMLAAAIAIYVFKNDGVALASIWTATVTGLPGIISQLIIIPIIFELFCKKVSK